MSSLLTIVIPFGQTSTRHYNIKIRDFFSIFSSLGLTFHYIWYIFSKTRGKPGKVRDVTPLRVDNTINQISALLNRNSQRQSTNPNIHSIYSENTFFQKNPVRAVRDIDHLNRHRCKKALS